MVIAEADHPERSADNFGSTVWSTIVPPEGKPAGVVIEADATVPDLKMRASMILRRNTDSYQTSG